LDVVGVIGAPACERQDMVGMVIVAELGSTGTVVSASTPLSLEDSLNILTGEGTDSTATSGSLGLLELPKLLRIVSAPAPSLLAFFIWRETPPPSKRIVPHSLAIFRVGAIADFVRLLPLGLCPFPFWRPFTCLLC